MIDSELASRIVRGTYYETKDGRVARVIKVNATKCELQWSHDRESLRPTEIARPKHTFVSHERLLNPYYFQEMP